MQDCYTKVFSNDIQVENQTTVSGKRVAEVDWIICSLFDGEKNRTYVNALQGDIDLLSRLTHDWRRGFRTIGELTCGHSIAANTSLNRFEVFEGKSRSCVDLSNSDSGKHVAEEGWRTGLLFGEKKSSCVISSNGSHRPTVKINARTEKRLSNDWQIVLLKSDSGKHVAEEDWRTGPLFGEKNRSCVVSSNGSR